MSGQSDRYLAALAEAKASGYDLTAQGLQQLDLILRAAARAMLAEITDAALTSERLPLLQARLAVILAVLERRAIVLTTQTVRAIADDVLAIHEAVTQEIAQQRLGQPLALAAFNAVAALALAGLAFRTLFRRHIEDARASLNRLTQGATTQSIPAGRLSQDVNAILFGREAEASPYGLPDGALTGLGTLRSDSRRILATEALTTLRGTSGEALRASPMIVAAQWHLSGRHSDLASSPDECDVLARSDFYGLGAGWYPTTRWPRAPHPWCGCTQGAVRFRPVAEWNQPKPGAPPLELEPSDMGFRGYAWSDRREIRARVTIARSLRA